LQKADLTTRVIAGLVDLLLVIGLARLPDVLGFLSAGGYILVRDGLFDGRSIGKKLIGLRILATEGSAPAPIFRESIIRNVSLFVVYVLFLVPYAGWVLGPLALGVEGLTAIGDEHGMRIGDMLARTRVCLDVPVVAGSDRSASQQPQAQATPTDTSAPQDTTQ
jgi:uncharacterized RDD family membrane protein YckC